VDDRGARAAEVRLDHDPATGWLVTTELRDLGGLALDATVTVRGGRGERWAAWSVSVRDRTPGGLRLTHVAFPWIALARGPSTAILQPFGAGRLIRGPLLDALEADTPAAFELRPETFDCLHYPGYTFAQFLAAMGPRAGVFVAARDGTGRPKLVKPLATDHGRIRLALAQLGDPQTLDTEVVVGGSPATGRTPLSCTASGR